MTLNTQKFLPRSKPSDSISNSLANVIESTVLVKQSTAKLYKFYFDKKKREEQLVKKQKRDKIIARDKQRKFDRETKLESKTELFKKNPKGVSGKAGVMGNILDALVMIGIGWLIKFIPSFIKKVKIFFSGIQKIFASIKRLVMQMGTVFNSMTAVVTQTIENWKRLDFWDSEGKIQEKIDEMNKSFDDLNKQWDEMTAEVKKLAEDLASEDPDDPTAGGSLLNVTGSAPVEDIEQDVEFQEAVRKLAARAKVNPSELMSLYNAESRLDPSIVNPENDAATGLFQLMFGGSFGDVRYGYTQEQFRRLSRADQVAIHEKYLQDAGFFRTAGGMGNLALANIRPADLGKLNMNSALYSSPSAAYVENKNIDLIYGNKDGSISLEEYINFIKLTGGEEQLRRFNTGTSETTQRQTTRRQTTQRPVRRRTPIAGTGLIPVRMGEPGFIQGGSSDSSETEYGTHFHIDGPRNPSASQLAEIRDVAFRAVKAMFARGSWVHFGSIGRDARRGISDQDLKSLIAAEQQAHGRRSSAAVDIQEHHPTAPQTFPSQVGSKTTFPFAVRQWRWRSGYGREAVIIGTNNITVSHGAPGSQASLVSQDSVAARSRQRPQIRRTVQDRRGRNAVVIGTPRMESPAPAPGSTMYRVQRDDTASVLNSISRVILAYT
jgi:hypothetical protein